MEKKLLLNNCLNDLKDQIDFFEKNSDKVISPGNTWSKRVNKILEELKENNELLLNFKKSNIFNSDIPAGNMNLVKKMLFDLFSLLPKFIGYHPYVNYLENSFKVIEEENALETLRRNQITLVGNPVVYRKKGLIFTYRWLRHILLLSYYEKKIKELNNVQIIADIGTGYGTFPILMKKNFKDKKFILIDLPEQLCAARYYIKSEFPEARIPDFKDIINCSKLDRNFFDNYDFSLVPCYLINKIEENSADMFTNFASLNEMPKSWFDEYLNSKLFKSSKYLFTMNRFDRDPMNENEKNSISILDMPFEEYKKIFFKVFPLYKWAYNPVKFLNIPIYAKKVWHDPSYIFIGKRNKNN